MKPLPRLQQLTLSQKAAADLLWALQIMKDYAGPTETWSRLSMKSRTTKKCSSSMLKEEKLLDEDEGMIYSDDELYQGYDDDELYQDFGQEKAPKKKKKVKLNICKSGAYIAPFLSDGDFVDDDSEIPQDVFSACHRQ